MDHDKHEQLSFWWGDGSYYGPAFRGDKLAPDDDPAYPGQYMSNVSPPQQQQQPQDSVKEMNSYISVMGALMLRPGPTPPDVFSRAWRNEGEDSRQPTWTHMAECTNDVERFD